MVVLVVLALVIALLYIYTPVFDRLKSKAVDITSSLYWVSDLPNQAKQWAGGRLVSRSHLAQENTALRAENLVLAQKIQKNAALEAENFRLRQLLNATETIEDRVLIAEVIGVVPGAQTHKAILNRGAQDGVFKGQAVIDAFGLMGQVVEVGANRSVVLLIVDASHAVPAQVNRNGVRVVAAGIGDRHSLVLRHLVNTVDIEIGDLLVSSGLGQRFPPGYPVAEVSDIRVDPGQSFAEIYATPMANIDGSRHVLLVFGKEQAR